MPQVYWKVIEREEKQDVHVCTLCNYEIYEDNCNKFLKRIIEHDKSHKSKDTEE